jgi:hypothetical protein
VRYNPRSAGGPAALELRRAHQLNVGKASVDLFKVLSMLIAHAAAPSGRAIFARSIATETEITGVMLRKCPSRVSSYA